MELFGDRGIVVLLSGPLDVFRCFSQGGFARFDGQLCLVDVIRHAESPWPPAADNRMVQQRVEAEEDGLAPELEPDVAWGAGLKAPLVRHLLDEPEPEASYPGRILQPWLDHPHADGGGGLFHLDTDVIVIGIDDQAERVLIWS